MQNIPTIVGIKHKGGGYKCIIYVQLIVIDIHIVTKSCYGGYGWCISLRAGEDMV